MDTCTKARFGSGTETSLSVARCCSARKQEGYIRIPVQGLSCFSSPRDLPMLGSVMIKLYRENYNKKKREKAPATELGTPQALITF